MTVAIISLSITTKVWGQAGIELTTPVSAVRLASVARHITDYATGPGTFTNGISICYYSIDRRILLKTGLGYRKPHMYLLVIMSLNHITNQGVILVIPVS